MKAIIYLTDSLQLDRLDPEKVELIIALAPFSRFPVQTHPELLESAKERGFKLHLEWDALMEEPQFRLITKVWPTEFQSVRVKDAGAALWVRDHTDCSIHFHMEAGHHNMMAVESWKKRLGLRLKRIIISNELPHKTIKEWSQSLGLEIELLSLGPLLLFHSPRKLLSPLRQPDVLTTIKATGASVESPHKGFPIVENRHGTFMFHPKDICLLDKWDELLSSGVHFYRIDMREEKPEVQKEVIQFISAPRLAGAAKFKESWSKEWMRGYWNTNKSDVLFEKLTNPYLQKNEDVVAEVIDTKKSHWMAVKILNHQLSQGQDVKVISPLGVEKSAQVVWMKDSAFKEVSVLNAGQVGFIPWVGGTPTKSILKFSL